MKYIFFTVMLIITLIILRINIKLYSENHSAAEQKVDIILQLNFLEEELKQKNLGARMQNIFPEGYVFVNALYGLTWCELALAEPNNQELKKKAIREALYAYDNVRSNEGTSFFQSDLKPEYGIFYSGWKNYLLSKILTLDQSFKGHESYIAEFKNQSDSISIALKASKSPFLESYSGQAWPADMTVAMASLSNYDKVLPPRYGPVINSWIKEVKKHLDPKTSLIPHMIDPETNRVMDGARGSSIGLILRMLADINPSFAQEQFNLFKPLFVSSTFGLPSIREYPIGREGSGDIDSGPVILGVGFTATIIQLGTLSLYSHGELGNQQYKTVNAFGFDRKPEDKKVYLLGYLPMADAFIAWGRATDLNHQTENKAGILSLWGWKFQFISILVLVIPWLVFYNKTLIRYIRSR